MNSTLDIEKLKQAVRAAGGIEYTPKEPEVTDPELSRRHDNSITVTSEPVTDSELRIRILNSSHGKLCKRLHNSKDVTADDSVVTNTESVTQVNNSESVTDDEAVTPQRRAELLDKYRMGFDVSNPPPMSEMREYLNSLPRRPIPDRFKCQNCGKLRCAAHYEQSPDCWEARQKQLEKWNKLPGRCLACGRKIFRERRTKRLCIHCLIKRKADRQRERREPLKAKPRKCLVCTKEFQPKRRDAITCSAKCRQIRHRVLAIQEVKQ